MSERVRENRSMSVGAKGLLARILFALLVAGWIQAKDLPDPTRPPGADALPTAERGSGETTDFALTAVFVSEGRRIAIINGARLREGDPIGTAVVESIGTRGVRLTRPEGPLDLDLVPRTVKRAAAPTNTPAMPTDPSPAATGPDVRPLAAHEEPRE